MDLNGYAAIRVRNLRKSYSGHDAVHGVSFEVAPGEVFGFLGPNGAGKTTTIEILEGYRARTAGDVRVLGVDPGKLSFLCDCLWRCHDQTSKTMVSSTTAVANVRTGA